MKDLTKDSITRHILTMAIPGAIGMLTQMAYQLIDLYFVTQIGEDAVAGVGTAGNASFLIMAITSASNISLDIECHVFLHSVLLETA